MYINIFIPDSCNMTQETEENKMSAKIDFLYLSEPDMIKAGVKDMAKCVEVMEDMMVTLKKGDYVMGGENHNSHGCMVTFPDNPEFEGMPKNEVVWLKH